MVRLLLASATDAMIAVLVVSLLKGAAAAAAD
jgi:hypothetical protein